jgi:hypothetical protein
MIDRQERTMSEPPDLSVELSVVSDVVFKTASVLGQLARRVGQDDLADEMAALMDRIVEVVDLEQKMRGRE